MHERLTDAQRRRLERFGAAEGVDLHCHCLPGLDDGPATADDAVALCRALAEDGTTTVVATPHQLGRYDGRNGAAVVTKAVASLQSRLDAEQVPLRILPGADVRLDERILPLLAAGEVLTVAGRGAWLLLELPHEAYIDPGPLIAALNARGVRSVITHPERHDAVRRSPDLVKPWLAAGAVLQLTAGSVVGDFGKFAEQAAWHWLAAGQAAVVATDAHDVARRPPRMTAAIDAIEKRAGAEFARRVCITNPAAIVSAAKAAPVAAPTSGNAAAPVKPRRPWGSGVLRET
jgi:protein-tyrosine phosphatase